MIQYNWVIVGYRIALRNITIIIIRRPIMKIAICDDEINARSEIASLVDEYAQHNKLRISSETYDSGEKLLSSELDHDVIFMDYHMEDIDGIETSRRIRELNKDCTIIFISAYPAVAPDCFEVNTFRFITKPIDSLKLFKALDDHLKATDCDKFLTLKTHDGVWRIRMSDIIYAEANGRHTNIRTIDKTIDIHIHLKKIEERLPKTKFIRSHRAYIVGFKHIANHTNEVIVFDNYEKAKIGKSYASAFKAAFSDYIIRYNKGLVK